MRDNDWTKILGWPGYRVWRTEIDEAAKALKLWVRRKPGNRKVVCSSCGRRVSDICEVYEREVRDLVSAFDLRMVAEDDRHISATVHVEPPKAIFLYRDGTMPGILPQLLGRSHLYPTFQTMRPAILLPYLATKFVLDAERAHAIDDGTAKCSKLMMDIVCLLVNASPRSIRQNISFAIELWIVREYSAALQCARPLAPEIDMLNLAGILSSNLVDELAEMVAARAVPDQKVPEKVNVPDGFAQNCNPEAVRPRMTQSHKHSVD